MERSLQLRVGKNNLACVCGSLHKSLMDRRHMKQFADKES